MLSKELFSKIFLSQILPEYILGYCRILSVLASKRF